MPRPKKDPNLNWAELQREWKARVVAEYHSAAFTAELVHLLIRIGAPYDLLYIAHRIIKDELIHAERSFTMFQALGGQEQLVELRDETLRLPVYSADTFAQVTCTTLQFFCLGETFAVPLFREMARRTKHHKATQVLKRILKDESVHREFGWSLLDYLVEQDSETTKEIARAHLGAFLRQYQQGYGTDHAALPERVGPKEEPFGVMPRARYVKVFEEALHQVILPRFAKRGIDAETLWRQASGTTAK
jgi:rubrerythrin